jgi:hypothetical protein
MRGADYRRNAEPPILNLDFPPAVVLDTARLRRRWAPWIDLTASDGTPVRAGHVRYLLDMLTGAMPPMVPNWFSIISPAGTRDQVVRQARLDHYLCPAPDLLPADEAWRPVTEAVRRWPELDARARTVLIGLLTQLGCHRTVVDLVSSVSVRTGDPEGQQLAYEVARSSRLLDRAATGPLRVFDWLATRADRPALRVSAAIQIASALTRAHGDPGGAATWLARAERESEGLRAEPEWLRDLVLSRYHRVAALVCVRGRRHPDSVSAMSAALACDERLAARACDELIRHYQRENRALVLEAFLKMDTMAGGDAAPADVVAQCAEVDPVDPDLQFALGGYLAARDRWDEAHRAYLASAGSGTMRGAVAAYQAGMCLDHLGRPGQARTAYQLCLDLDPASISAAERLAVPALTGTRERP